MGHRDTVCGCGYMGHWDIGTPLLTVMLGHGDTVCGCRYMGHWDMGHMDSLVDCNIGTWDIGTCPSITL